MSAAGAGVAPQSVAEATHELYQQYGKQIYAYCLHQLRSREEAEDAVQTTFLNAFRGLQRGTVTRFEQAWLYKIAQNVCIARRSSSGRRLRLETPNNLDLLEEVIPATESESPLELMGLDEALEQMPENQRRAILLREWQGLSYREIGEELGLSQGAVEMLIFRARRTLASALEQPTKGKVRKARTGMSVGSIVAALKSLLGTGAALKLAAVAVTAAVVGTNAARTFVHHPGVRVTHTPPATKAVAPVVRARMTPTFVPAAVPPTLRAPSARHAGKPAPAVANVFVATKRPVVAADPMPPAPAAAPTPAPAPVAPPTVQSTPPSPPQPSAPPGQRSPQQDPPRPQAAPQPNGGDGTTGTTSTPTTTTSAPPVPIPSDPGNTQGNGDGNGTANGHGHDQAPPAPAAPGPAPTTPVVTSPTLPPPAPGNPQGNGNGNGTANGHGQDPSPAATIPPGQPPATTPAAHVPPPSPGNSQGNGNANGQGDGGGHGQGQGQAHGKGGG